MSMGEIYFRNKTSIEYLEWFVSKYKKGKLMSLIGYPAQAAVNASIAQLNGLYLAREGLLK